MHIKGGRGKKIEYKINHPPLKDKYGNIDRPFYGEIYINTNDYKIYIGDCIWEPVCDKNGKWKINTFFNKELIVSKTFYII